MSDLADQAYAAVLAGLDRMTVGRLDLLISGRPAAHAYQMVMGDRPPTGLIGQLFDTNGLLATWRAAALRRPPEQMWEECLRLGITVLVRGTEEYPSMLSADPAPAPVLFMRGSFTGLTGRRVGIVGTRNATASGRDIATEMSRELATVGVHIVSGLARGIDGCSHRGALSVSGGAGPIGVVASGLDVVYPREHTALWNAVAECGALLSEVPPGTAPEPYRFPMRNRIIAGLSEVLLVVESRETGGSLITATEAALRNVLVMAVPGAVRNRAARGTNDLIRDGCPIATDARDVLVALGLDTRRAGPVAYDPRLRPSGTDAAVLAMCCEPRTLDQLAVSSGLALAECAMSLARLEFHGWVRQISGWFESTSGATTRTGARW